MLTPAEKWFGVTASKLLSQLGWTDPDARSRVHAVLNAMHSLGARRNTSAQAWQAEKRASGLCITCGVNPLATKNHCRDCADKHAAAKKAKRNAKYQPPPL